MQGEIRLVLLALLVMCVHHVVYTRAHPLLSEWEQWRERQGRSYGSPLEEEDRRAVWMDNYKSVSKHNSLNGSVFSVKLNQFANLTAEEFNQHYLMNNVGGSTEESSRAGIDVAGSVMCGGGGGGVCQKHVCGSNKTYPAWMDWRIHGLVSEVKSQGSCSSSWAFSATGALEGQHYKKGRYLTKFSEQQLLDCSEDYGNRGCYGGLALNAFLYVQNAGGICKESGYPYLGYVWQCVDLYCSKVTSCSSAFSIESGSEQHLLDALYETGPISVVIDGSGNLFQFYSGGVYSSTECSKVTLNQAMLLVGYGTDTNAGDYWILKNSFGTEWGIEGYMKLARNNNNMCGIATAATYPKL